MILVHINTPDEKQAIEIADMLVSQKLILDALHIPGTKRARNDDGSTSTQDQYLVLGKTKALLFNQIDKIIREKYPENVPTLYSIPIVNMDWDQADELMEKTEKV